MTHVCRICGRGFRKSDHLSQHERDKAKVHKQTRLAVRAEARRPGGSVDFRRNGLVFAFAKGGPK